MDPSSVQEMASAFTLTIVLGILLVPCRVWCRRVAGRVLIGCHATRASLTARILRAMSWRVAILVSILCGLGITSGDSKAAGLLMSAAILSYPMTLLSLWQIARRVSKRAFDIPLPEQELMEPQGTRRSITATDREKIMGRSSVCPTVIEAIVGINLLLALHSFVDAPRLQRPTGGSPSTVAARSETPAALATTSEPELHPSAEASMGQIKLSSGAIILLSEPLHFQSSPHFRSTLIKRLESQGWPCGDTFWVNDNLYSVVHSGKGYGSPDKACSTMFSDAPPCTHVELTNGVWAQFELFDGYYEEVTNKKVITESGVCYLYSNEKNTAVIIAVADLKTKIGFQHPRPLADYSKDERVRFLLSAVELHKIAGQIANGFALP